MPKFLEVVILGKSLLVAGMAARLKDSSAFRVTYVELPIAAALAALALIVPDVVIFDMQDADDASVGSLVFQFPGMKLIGLKGLEPSLVIISSELQMENMEDLAQAITSN